MSIARSTLTSRLGFGAVATGGEEGRALVQRRLAFYLGGVSLMWLTISATGASSTLLFMPQLMSAPGATRAGIIHHLGLIGLAAAWLFCRRGRRSLAVLSWVDAGTTIAFSLVMSSIMDAVDLRFRPDMSMTLGLSCALIGRAAVVPSRGGRTLAIGAVAAVPVVLATWFAHVAAGAGRPMPPPVPTLQIAMWLLFGVLLSTTISRVIYGLSRQVQDAARLGQYTLQQKIGEGAMGVVYLARHALLRRPTAIKLLAAGRTGQQALERFEREVQTTSALRHPNTVAIYDYGHTPDGVFYYAMEYLDGVDLELLIQREGPLPEARAVHILIQIAGALDEAHAAGLVHRDIKPSNVLLCDQGHRADFAKVLDFGLVKELATDVTDASSTQTLTGTPLYMSPESINAPATIDGRSDIYSLGALGYALVTGTPPFAGATTVEVCAQHLYSPVVPPSARRAQPLSPQLDALLVRCLAKDRSQRPARAALLAEELAGCAVAFWTDADARAWWDTRGGTLRAERRASAASAGGDTLAIDLAARAREVG
ncbi:MAG: serine/threonine-protein kinase [Myxococcales bacterium]